MRFAEVFKSVVLILSIVVVWFLNSSYRFLSSPTLLSTDVSTPVDAYASIFSSKLVLGCSVHNVKRFCEQYPDRRTGRSYWIAQQAVREHLPKLANAFRRAGIPPIITLGTVLGFLRECASIRGDRDVDLWVPRHFFPALANYTNFLQVLGDSGYRCRTTHGKFGEAGLQFMCEIPNISVNTLYFDVRVLDEDFATGGCQQPPCKWTDYLYIRKTLRRGVVGPFGFRLIAWQHTTFWAPYPPQNLVLATYGGDWRKPGGRKYLQYFAGDTVIPSDRAKSSFRNRLVLSPQKIVEMQGRLERQYAEQIKTAAEQQDRLFEWCNGDCVWVSGVCIPKTELSKMAPKNCSASKVVSCGRRQAKCCSECPQDHCRGDCVLIEDECTDPPENSKCSAFEGSVICGGRKEMCCSECQWCNGDCFQLEGECLAKDKLQKKRIDVSNLQNKSSVSCGKRRANKCSECPEDPNSAWCLVDCVLFHDECVEKNMLEKRIH